MNRLQLFLLGPPEIRLDDAPFVLTPVKARGLLFYLAVTGRPHNRSHLAGLLWGGLPEENARRNLRGAISQLRPALDNYLLAERRTLAFNQEAPYWLDTTILQRAMSGAPEQDKELRTAVSLYRDEFLAQFQVQDAPEFESWLTLERERWRQLLLEAREKLAGAAAARGELALAIEDMRAILSIDSWREEAHRQLMALLAQNGRRSEALAQYEICRRLLAEELGVEPSAETVALVEQIKAGEMGSRGVIISPSPHLPNSPTSPHNLPAETTPFIGRLAELNQIAGLLADPGCRLLTLFGPGGMGKTRLARQAAANALNAFADGVYLVALEAVDAARLLAATIANALGVHLSGRQEPRAALLDYLRERRLLLVLDNFEQLLAESDLLLEMLETAPGVKLLVTSREALNLYEEWVFEVQGLAYPAEATTGNLAQFDAAALFQQRARRAYLGFDLAGNETAVSEICRLFLGMPLGIELAAAWIRTIPCAEIARRIGANLNSLPTSLRNMPARHRSMVAVCDHSWDLLRPAEKRQLRQLAVFRGGFTAEAAQQVAGAGRRDLSALVDKALLQVAPSGRYDLHPLIRHYVAGKLTAHPDELAESQTRHTAFYAAFLANLTKALNGRDQQQALQAITGEIANARTAWTAAVTEHAFERLDQMVEPLFHFYNKRGLQQEGFQQFDLAVAVTRAKGPTNLLTRLLVRQGRLSEHVSHSFTLPESLLVEGLALAREQALPEECAQALMGLGLLALLQGQPEDADAYLQDSQVISRQANIPWTLANVLILLAWLYSGRGQGEQAKAMCQEAIALHQEVGDVNGVAAGLTALGKVYNELDEWPEAEAAYREALAICRRHNHRVGEGQALTGLFAACYRQGKVEQAAVYVQESLAVNQVVGNRLGMAIAYHNLGFLAANDGRHAEAVAHYRQTLSIYHTTGVDEARRHNTEHYLSQSLQAMGQPD